MRDVAFQRCINPACGGTADLSDTAFRCPRCGGLVDVAYDWGRLPVPRSLKHFESKWANRSNPLDFSGVWRFRELLPFAPESAVVTIGEGQTLCQKADAVARYAGLNPGRLFLQYEGMNPSGSFKDNGMCAAFTHARMTGARRAACASTGNTSASLAIYCAATQLMRGVIFIGSGKISYGKLSQALEHGALTIQIEGDFDDALRRVREVSRQLGIYLVNSVNPFRLEGQKAIMYRVLEALRWEVPDWVVVPGGNLGNASSFAKAFAELKELGLIPRVPRLAVVNAAGADTFHQLHGSHGLRWDFPPTRQSSAGDLPRLPRPARSSADRGGDPTVGGEGAPLTSPPEGEVAGRAQRSPAGGGGVSAHFDQAKIDAYFASLDASNRRADTLASAIEINRPVNLPKALRAMDICDGVVRAVPDAEILDAKAQVGAGGLGCEPASGASVAGLRQLVREGVIGKGERVVCVLTGHLLKDPDETVAYHAADAAVFEAKLGKRGVKSVAFANRAVQVPNDLDAIVKAIEQNA